jgi:hypothetical protein
MDEVVLEYQLTPDDIRPILWGASPKTNRMFVGIIVSVAFVVVAAASANHELILAVILVALPADVLVTRFWIAPRRYWRLTLGVREPKELKIDNQGITSKSESVEIRYEWSRFSGTRETNDYFYLLPSKDSTGIAFPKRGLRSTDDEEKLRTIFEFHAPVTREDRITRPGLVSKLVLLSLTVILVMFIYVEVRIH